uniref:Uncharacterized protein n=1 Tax=Anguilla anguilla TaxID=7936 RepID=A0A0E9WYG6_ANGAN
MHSSTHIHTRKKALKNTKINHTQNFSASPLANFLGSFFVVFFFFFFLLNKICLTCGKSLSSTLVSESTQT